MLAVTETALPGLALSVPSVVSRGPQPYVAIRVSGPMRDLPSFAPQKFPMLHQWMRERNIEPGDGFFRYRAFRKSGEADIEVGTMTKSPVAAAGEVVAGEMPAGRYVQATLAGPYDRLFDAFLMLDGWSRGRGLQAAGSPGRPGCQVEIYRISPAHTTDPARWETDLLVQIKD